MYLFCLVQQAQEDLHAKYKEMEKELKLYKEKEAALPAPPVLSAPPKVVPSAPPQVVAPPKVVSSAPSIPPAGLLQEDSLASSALPGESLDGSLANAKAVVEKCFVITGKKRTRRPKGRLPFLTSSGTVPSHWMVQPSRKRCLNWLADSVTRSLVKWACT